VETDERMQFYPSGNTSFFNTNDRPLINCSVDDILQQLEGDDILERLSDQIQDGVLRVFMNMWC
jgi:hypothetical protein